LAELGGVVAWIAYLALRATVEVMGTLTVNGHIGHYGKE